MLRRKAKSSSLTERLNRALAESELLNAIATAASGEHELAKILAAALDHLNRVLRFTGGSIALVEDDELVIVAAIGPFADQALGQRRGRGAIHSWRVIDEGTPLLSGDVVAAGFQPTTPLRSYLAVPLIWEWRAFGLMEVDSTEADAFGPDDVRVLERVATILSGPIQMAKRYAAESRALMEARQARARVELLAEAGRALAGSLDYETILAAVAHLAVPALADWCIIDLIASDGTLRQVAAAHVRPDLEPVIRNLRRSYPPREHHTIHQVVRTGRAELVARITRADLAARAIDEEHLRMLTDLGIASHMVVPLKARGRTLGAISFVSGVSNRTYTPEDLSLAEELSNRAAVAIDNTNLYAAESTARSTAEKALERVDAVNRLISAASAADNLGDVFDDLGDILQSIVPFRRVAVALHRPDTDTLEVPYFIGWSLPPPLRTLEGPKAGTVRGWVIDTGRPFIRVDTALTQEFPEDELLGASGLRAYMVLPMAVSGRVVGAMHFAHSTPGFYTPEAARVAQPVADHLALTVSRYELFEQMHRRAGELSETLQRALLPARLPRPPFATLHALYLPADPEAGVGGDWYDALLLPDDSILLSLGDVAGHGVPAAAAMGQVRRLVQAYALEGRRPAEIIGAVNRFLSALPDAHLLSLWVGILDPVSGRLAYCGAGHPPALLCFPDGTVQFTALSGPPVGFSARDYRESDLPLPAGTRLISYTDGLLEAARDIADAERRLRAAALDTADLPPADALAQIVDRVLAGTGHEDDIAVLMAQTAEDGAPLEFELPAVPESLPRVRRAMRVYGRRLGLTAEQVESVVIAVGEAALNTIEHAYRGSPDVVVVRARPRGEFLVVEVIDRGQWRMVTQQGRGRGVHIMSGFAHTVRTTSGSGGTTVELTFPVGSRP